MFASRVLILTASLMLAPEGRAAEFVVTTTANDGTGSLRQAIHDANSNAGPDRIVFNIPGDGVHTIRATTPLPDFLEPVVIDGYTQPGSRANSRPSGRTPAC
ncbi:MAG TPA: hypothetical protein VNO52_18425 [Methylomirabilota bacterium]|nr:hypothetical protein [Methylomirabilota bacterium]